MTPACALGRGLVVVTVSAPGAATTNLRVAVAVMGGAELSVTSTVIETVVFASEGGGVPERSPVLESDAPLHGGLDPVGNSQV